ncbi:MAG: hypothetical protein WED09_00875 [Homoserinimonas sp.]
MRSASPLAAVTIAVAVLLAGCLPQEPEVIPPPESTTEPVFASDEEALAAATEAYKAYLAMSDLIAQEGGKEPERIQAVAVRDAFADAMAGYEILGERQYRSVGTSGISSTSLQRYSSAETSDVVAIYACLDLAGVDVLNHSGDSVVEDSRPDVQPFEVTFDLREDEPAQLIVSSREPWAGDDFCVE